MKRRSARDNALNSPTPLLLGLCLQAPFPRKARLGWGKLLGATEGGKTMVVKLYVINWGDFTLDICLFERCNRCEKLFHFS